MSNHPTMGPPASASTALGTTAPFRPLDIVKANLWQNIFVQNSSVVSIRQALLHCPDEYPPPLTADLELIPDQDLRDSIRRDVGGASQALHNGEWKAATVLAGAAALLHWKLGQLPPTEQANGVSAAVSQGKLNQKPPANLDRWGLQDFIEVAGELKLIKPATVAAATLARDFRNLIHPGAAARRAEVCDRATALSALAGREHVVRDLS